MLITSPFISILVGEHMPLGCFAALISYIIRRCHNRIVWSLRHQFYIFACCIWFHRWNHGLKIFFGRRSLTWIYIVAKEFYTFIIRTSFTHYRLLQHTRHLKELLAKVFIQSSCNMKLLSMPALLKRLSLLKSVFCPYAGSEGSLWGCPGPGMDWYTISHEQDCIHRYIYKLSL
jgi:hypothetical protein